MSRNTLVYASRYLKSMTNLQREMSKKKDLFFLSNSKKGDNFIKNNCF